MQRTSGAQSGRWSSTKPNYVSFPRGISKRWPHKVDPLTVKQINIAIDNPDWQEFRKALKGRSTVDKLIYLHEYLFQELDCDMIGRVCPLRKIRVDNYINALKRGGQLNMNLEIVK